MINRYDAYNIINQSIARVAKDLVIVQAAEVKERPIMERVEEVPFDLAQKNFRLESVIVAHELNQYVNRFYSVNMMDEEKSWLDILWEGETEYVCLADVGGNDES